ncbi:hypothetical protein GCM10010469_27060 [Streptomyces labedae]|uniref:Tyr recombinase domain-containing protein n=1 Tax=Streptomyces labedae TaxID=285569 RepID=A0ABP6QVK4_9ACTN
MLATVEPPLTAAWWSDLRTALVHLSAVHTDRTAVRQAYLDRAMPKYLAFIGVPVPTTPLSWSTAHGDLHWANLLAAVSYVGGYRRARGRRLVGLFAAMYFGGLRPAEAVGLAETDLNLPGQGWGSALLHRTRPSVGKQWTDSGETHDDRGLKNRPTEDVRRVPIPPHLVAVLREHLATFGTADDGRLFFSEKGSVVPSSTYYRVWQEARLLALPPAGAASPLASRPYDLRHSALSTWLNAGVDPTEVAERAGNSVEVLLTRYAKCLDGRQDVANRRIEDLLREYE